MKKFAIFVLLIFLTVLIYWFFNYLTPQRHANEKAAKESEKMTLLVYFANTELNPGFRDCSKVYPLKRKVKKTKSVATAALNELFSGPTSKEKQLGYTSWFSYKTKDILKTITIKDATAHVDIRDIRHIIPGASSSCGSAQLLAEIESTLFQFPGIHNVVIAIDSNPETFYNWLQIGFAESQKR